MRICQAKISLIALVALGAALAASANTDWPEWRGPGANGSTAGSPPVTWSKTENVRWVIDIPGRGFSTPIILGNKIFVTTAVPKGHAAAVPAPQAPPQGGQPGGRGGRGMRGGDPSATLEHDFVLLCLDRASGKEIWKKTAITATPHEGYHPQYGSHASGSPITDGERVYAFFGSRGLYCYDLEGKLLWKRDFGVKMSIFNAFGEGSSPALHGEKIFVVFDHMGGSFIAALNKMTGEPIWQTPRPNDTRSWVTPYFVAAGGKTYAVLSGNQNAHAYDIESGKVVWTGEGHGRGNAMATAVAAGDLIYLKMGPGLQAHRIADLSKAEAAQSLAWQSTENMGSNNPSPMILGNEVYTLRSNGVISCFDAKTGQPHYQGQRLPVNAEFKSSPVGAGDRIYLTSELGQVIVLKAGPKFEVLGVNEMGEMMLPSPSVSGNDLLIRTMTKLYCISGS